MGRLWGHGERAAWGFHESCDSNPVNPVHPVEMGSCSGFDSCRPFQDHVLRPEFNKCVIINIFSQHTFATLGYGFIVKLEFLPSKVIEYLSKTFRPIRTSPSS